jgi:hypothetical protein
LPGYGSGVGVAAKYIEWRGEPVDQSAIALHRQRGDTLDCDAKAAQIEEQSQRRHIRTAFVGNDRYTRARQLGFQGHGDFPADVGAFGEDSDR